MLELLDRQDDSNLIAVIQFLNGDGGKLDGFIVGAVDGVVPPDHRDIGVAVVILLLLASRIAAVPGKQVPVITHLPALYLLVAADGGQSDDEGAEGALELMVGVTGEAEGGIGIVADEAVRVGAGQVAVGGVDQSIPAVTGETCALVAYDTPGREIGGANEASVIGEQVVGGPAGGAGGAVQACRTEAVAAGRQVGICLVVPRERKAGVVGGELAIERIAGEALERAIAGEAVEPAWAARLQRVVVVLESGWTAQRQTSEGSCIQDRIEGVIAHEVGKGCVGDVETVRGTHATVGHIDSVAA
jgi:hypothetical protein